PSSWSRASSRNDPDSNEARLLTADGHRVIDVDWSTPERDRVRSSRLEKLSVQRDLDEILERTRAVIEHGGREVKRAIRAHVPSQLGWPVRKLLAREVGPAFDRGLDKPIHSAPERIWHPC